MSKQLPDSRDYEAIAKWIRDLCLMFGSSLGTAYIVAGHFVEGLQREHAKKDAS